MLNLIYECRKCGAGLRECDLNNKLVCPQCGSEDLQRVKQLTLFDEGGEFELDLPEEARRILSEG